MKKSILYNYTIVYHPTDNEAEKGEKSKKGDKSKKGQDDQS